MNRSSIARILEETAAFLGEDGPFLMNSSDRQEFVERARTLLEKARHPGEVLYVGILGGTGVGKSTLINALAREEISPASDRRPFTDKGVVYRHEETPRGLEEIAHLVRDPDALHQSEVVKDLILLDLPDFDSFRGDHRRVVDEILPRLDCVLWVVSPEKYADEVFYRLVRSTIINRDNFTFVLNKADELAKDDRGDPHAKFKDVLGDFTFRLKHEGAVEEPRVFMVSAAHECRGGDEDPVLQKEFTRFREFLMVRRDAKEIASLKTQNLAEETRALLDDLHRNVRPDDKARLVTSIREIQGDTGQREGPPSLRLLEQQDRLASIIFDQLMSKDASIGSVRLAMKALRWQRYVVPRAAETQLDHVLQATVEIISKERLGELEKYGAQMDSELMLRLPDQGRGRMGNDAEQVVESALRRASAVFTESLHLRRKSMAGLRSRLTRFVQKLVLFLPVPVLLVKLIGHARLEAWVDQPSVSGGLNLILALLSSLFSSEGLTGLAVLLICEVLLIWYLASMRLKKMRKDSRRLAASAIRYLDESVKSAEDRAREAREETVRRIEDGINRLADLEQAFTSTRTRPRVAAAVADSGPHR
ncbi:MAG: 50S ribosome-binding GTPase [Deltaproteobacteria bacterium]